MAVNVEDRLSLRDVLFRTSQAVSNKTEGSFLLYQTAESDKDIRQFLQEMIYDASPAPPTPPPLRPPPGLANGGQPPVVITISS